ncbi:hypothetical protein [Amycolatopsis alkalitolerans]|uniref:hypothetical protein n=1 Tax=Amycolatopsis alkalitolerans TaxID=2547244 RepID=UPI001F17FAE5|nr:hypothetical protein [Amycolatopsis alkalitolerans]
MLVLAVVAGGVTWLVLASRKPPPPACSFADYSVAPEQAQNAATIAAVGMRLGMPDHAVTVALATAMQESKLRNLTGGDRDSAGLFQQRPSQGWGTYQQVTDPIHAATAFYERLRAQPNWMNLTVTQAAQLVQRSAAPDGYARWESEARALAGALTGETPGVFTCHDLVPGAPAADLVTTADAELGTAVFTGPHDATRGWALATWLVANANRFAVDRVTFDGRTWTASDGAWSASGPPDGQLSLHQATPAS